MIIICVLLVSAKILFNTWAAASDYIKYSVVSKILAPAPAKITITQEFNVLEREKHLPGLIT